MLGELILLGLIPLVFFKKIIKLAKYRNKNKLLGKDYLP